MYVVTHLSFVEISHVNNLMFAYNYIVCNIDKFFKYFKIWEIWWNNQFWLVWITSQGYQDYIKL